jgi:hypothetical protein
MFLLILGSVSVIGCGSTRAVFVGSTARNDLIRVAPNVKARAYIWDGSEWILSKNKIEYPEGAYVGFLDDEEEGSPSSGGD